MYAQQAIQCRNTVPDPADDSRSSGATLLGVEGVEVRGMDMESNQPTERALIRLAADGDARAIRALYDRYAPRVYAVVRRIAGDDDLAQDYAQEAWIRAIDLLAQ